MKQTWRYPSDGGEPYEVFSGYSSGLVNHHVINDIDPFRSPDGAHISGRKEWREHLKRTDSIEMSHSDVKYAQTVWNKRKEVQRERLKGQVQMVQNFDKPGAPIAPSRMSGLNVEMANRLHNRPAPERKEMLKMTLDQMKRMK